MLRAMSKFLLAFPLFYFSRLCLRLYLLILTFFLFFFFFDATLHHRTRDENPVGNWSLRLVDQVNPKLTGRFINWKITFWGERDQAFVGEPMATPVEEGTALPTETVTTAVTKTQTQHVATLTTSSHALETITTSSATHSNVVSTKTSSATNTFEAKPGGMLEDIEKPEQSTASAQHGSTSTTTSSPTFSAAATAGSSQKGGSFFFYAIAGSSLIVVVAGLAYFTKRGRQNKRGGGGGVGGGENGYEFEVLTNEPDDGGDHLSSSPMLGRGRKDSTEMKQIGERYRDDDEVDHRLGNGNGNGVTNGNGVANGKKKESVNGNVEVMFDRGDLDEFLTNDDEDARVVHTREHNEFVGGNRVSAGSTEEELAQNSSWEDFTPMVRTHGDEEH